MKVLHVTFNMGIGGTEQVIRQLIGGLDKIGVQNEVFCIDGTVGSMGRELEAAGVPFHTFVRQPGIDRALVAAIRETLGREKFDIVHCHQYTPYFYGWLAAFGTGTRVVFTEHGRFHPDRPRYKAILVNPVLARLTPRIVAISQATATALVRNEFIPRSRIQVIYNGIAGLNPDPGRSSALKARLAIPAEAPVFGTVSRLDTVKNQTMMLHAFTRVLATVADAYLLMVGDGPERERLEALADELGIASRVIFTGFIDHPEDHLAVMDVFLLSSHTEGTSMTLLEAMSLGVPQVATRVGGNPEIVVDGHTGYLTPPDDAAAFADAMTRLQSSAETRRIMAGHSRDRFRQSFTVDAMVGQYHRVYQDVTRGVRRHVQ